MPPWKVFLRILSKTSVALSKTMCRSTGGGVGKASFEAFRGNEMRGENYLQAELFFNILNKNRY
jgi:hypothetical protein